MGTTEIIYLAKFICGSNKIPISKVYKLDISYDTKCNYLINVKLEINLIIYLSVYTFVQIELNLLRHILEVSPVFIILANYCQQHT